MLKWIISGVVLCGLILLAPVLWVLVGDPPAPPASTGLPWQIETPAPGESRVFGLQPGTSTVAEAINKFGPVVDIAIVAPPTEKASLEAYFERVALGSVLGKLIITIDADDAALEQMSVRAKKVEYMESTTRKITLNDADLADARGRAVAAITFIPSANLDEEIILQRFGTPALRVRVSDELEHFLYPEKGLDLALSSRGKEVLQYIAPKDFQRLRAPLVESAVAPSDTDKP